MEKEITQISSATLNCKNLILIFIVYSMTFFALHFYISKIMCSRQQLQMLIDNIILICNCKLEFKGSDSIDSLLHYITILFTDASFFMLDAHISDFCSYSQT